MMEKLKYGKNAKEPARLLMVYINHVHTITGDNGTKFAEHQNIAEKLNTEFFFTNPYSA